MPSPRLAHSLCLLPVVLATAVVAQEPAGLVTGSFGDMPLEMPVPSETGSAMIVGTFADASFLAMQSVGDQGPANLALSFSGELPDPDEVTLEIAFARDMGRNWRGDQNSLSLTVGAFDAADGFVAAAGTVTGEVSGGPASETRPVTFSFNVRLVQDES